MERDTCLIAARDFMVCPMLCRASSSRPPIITENTSWLTLRARSTDVIGHVTIRRVFAILWLAVGGPPKPCLYFGWINKRSGG